MALRNKLTQKVLTSSKAQSLHKKDFLHGGTEIVSGSLHSTLAINVLLTLFEEEGQKAYGITTAHGVGDVGTDVENASGSKIGVVAHKILDGQRDAAFIELTDENLTPVICTISTGMDLGVLEVSLGAETPDVGVAIHKFGIQTGHTYGAVEIKEIGITTAEGSSVQGGLADYDSNAGDSGAPVLKLNTDKTFGFIGYHIGTPVLNSEQREKLGLSVDGASSIFETLSNLIDASCE